MGGRKGRTDRSPLALPNSRVTRNFSARHNFSFIHLPYFPYKKKGSLKASAMFYPILNPSENMGLIIRKCLSILNSNKYFRSCLL